MSDTRDRSLAKVLALQAYGPEFDPITHLKKKNGHGGIHCEPRTKMVKTGGFLRLTGQPT